MDFLMTHHWMWFFNTPHRDLPIPIDEDDVSKDLTIYCQHPIGGNANAVQGIFVTMAMAVLDSLVDLLRGADRASLYHIPPDWSYSTTTIDRVLILVKRGDSEIAAIDRPVQVQGRANGTKTVPGGVNHHDQAITVFTDAVAVIDVFNDLYLTHTTGQQGCELIRDKLLSDSRNQLGPVAVTEIYLGHRTAGCLEDIHRRGMNHCR